MNEKILNWLYGLQVHGIKLGLDNMTELLRRLGNPQSSFKSIHVAGTDGKGSTCHFISSILRTSKIKTGSYTSPHLVNFTERISIDGVDIEVNELNELVHLIRPVVESMSQEGIHCSFFEVTTSMAFLFFKNKGVEYAVIEVGMGGRYDATNIIIPEVSVISNISIDHTQYLGDNLKDIAWEKAGIIKEGVPCVTINGEEVSTVIRGVAIEKSAPLIEICLEDIEVISNTQNSLKFTYKGEKYETTILGRYQAKNASLAIEAVSRLEIYGQCLRCNIKKGLKDAKISCRLEKMKDLPVILDVTHTEEGAKNLTLNISEIYNKIILVFGILNDKNLKAIAKELSSISSKVIVTQPKSERTVSSVKVAEVFSKFFEDIIITENVPQAMNAAFKERKEDELILVTGSFYMAGEVLRWSKKDICTILDTLSKEYNKGAYPGRSSEGLNPEWECDPFHVLVATILSQRTRDDNTRKASDNLFNKYNSLELLASANLNDVTELIRPAGFPNQKAKAIIECCKIIKEKYGGIVPSETEELISLPMVGRKTAACTRSYSMDIPSVCVDTHVHRIANLMGLVDTKDTESTEYALMNITPENRWNDINRYLVRHGQEVCYPNRSHCERCSVRDQCDYYFKICEQ